VPIEIKEREINNIKFQKHLRGILIDFLLRYFEDIPVDIFHNTGDCS
jgi:hypothetical protein